MSDDYVIDITLCFLYILLKEIINFNLTSQLAVQNCRGASWELHMCFEKHRHEGVLVSLFVSPGVASRIHPFRCDSARRSGEALTLNLFVN